MESWKITGALKLAFSFAAIYQATRHYKQVSYPGLTRSTLAPGTGPLKALSPKPHCYYKVNKRLAPRWEDKNISYHNCLSHKKPSKGETSMVVMETGVVKGPRGNAERHSSA